MTGKPAPVVLRKNLARAIRDGHPWIFRDAVEPPGPLPDGALVEVRARSGRPLAAGYWSADSPIAVRVLEPGPLPDVRGTLEERVRAALRRRLERLDLARTNAFRWVHGEADRLPGVHVDLYDDVAVLRFDGAGAAAFYRDLGGVLAGARPLRSALDRQSGKLLQGAALPGELWAKENGLWFEVSPGAGGKGGLFLDQRENRELVESRAEGRTVLDLFGSTGGFSLYAARGGARSTDTVDTARPALASARRNFERNGLPLETARFHAADAFEFLEAARGRRWDLVVSDPPSFAPRKSARPAALRAYRRLHRLAAAATAPGGLLLAASCSSHFGRDEFVETLLAGAREAGRRFEPEDVRGPGFDHPSLPSFPEGDYLTFAAGRVR